MYTTKYSSAEAHAFGGYRSHFVSPSLSTDFQILITSSTYLEIDENVNCSSIGVKSEYRLRHTDAVMPKVNLLCLIAHVICEVHAAL